MLVELLSTNKDMVTITNRLMGTNYLPTSSLVRTAHAICRCLVQSPSDVSSRKHFKILNVFLAAAMYFCWYYPVGLYHNAEAADQVAERGLLSFPFFSTGFYDIHLYIHRHGKSRLPLRQAPSKQVPGAQSALLSFVISTTFDPIHGGFEKGAATCAELPQVQVWALQH